ncbi:MAG: FAD-dependent oxidoreductase, partial [Parvularculaceae bacterium]|nr:FAD-dependent oxidoreductase [Parvularculaceae bacterium]
LIAAKDSLVGELRQKKYADLIKDYEAISYVEGAARFADGGVKVAGKLIRAPKIIIATGARPGVPPIPGVEKVSFLTSTSLLDLEALPKSLVVIGGGFIGAELAQMMARMGVVVSVICRSQLLPQAEPEISQALSDVFRGEGIRLYCGIAYDSCREDESGVTVWVNKDDQIIAVKGERLLIATGRTPNTDDLGLAEAGVKLDRRGAIMVDDHMRTTRTDVYAAGDVTNRDQFVYMAAYGAKIAAKNALNGDSLRYDNAAMPWVVFTDPQIAGVGVGEADARFAERAAKTSILRLEQLPRALAARDTRGLIKLVADAETGKLLGGQIMAPEGADSIQTLALALKAGMTARELGETLFPYLTTVEGLKLAAQGFEMDVAKLSCCAG